MRKKEREITDPAEIERIIQNAIVCRVAMVDGNEPYIVPLCFGYENRTFYFHSAKAGRKLDILRKNNRVCFEIDADAEVLSSEKACNFWLKYRSVIGTGKASFIEGEAEKTHALNVIMKHYTGKEFSIAKAELEPVLVWKISVDNLSGKKAHC